MAGPQVSELLQFLLNIDKVSATVLSFFKYWWVLIEKNSDWSICMYNYIEVQPVHSKGDQSWVFFGRNDAKAETLVLWPLHAKSWLIGKDPDAGRRGKEKKGTTEDEMAGWHHRLDGCESEWSPGVGDGQGGLACCDSWGHKESDTTERLNWTEHRYNSFQSPLSLTVWFVLPNNFLWKIKIFLVLRSLITAPHLSPHPLSHSHLFSVTPSRSFSLHLHACKCTHRIYMWVCYMLYFINSKTYYYVL